MKFKIIFCISLFICLNLSFTVFAENEGLLSLENKYIKVFVNNMEEDMGRFAVDVTGGDPNREDDNNKPLIYGHPKPWTSFTTLQIDGANYVFGKATKRRSGNGLPGGEILENPKLDDGRLTMKCRYNSIEVEQLLDITRSPSTGVLDTARIKYIIKNIGNTSVDIGLRALLDTMVGDNDGAPFRVGNKEVTSDYSCIGKEAPDFWQAFDSMMKPAVIAQGTLKGSDIITPDRIIFTNWGKAADNPWDIPVETGADFIRLGEDELDSSVAMYWSPRPLKPQEKLNIVIYYGLGGITFAPGKTYLGISAPAEIEYNETNNRSYTVMMYLEHRGEAKAQNVKINLSLPKGLECSSGKTTVLLPELLPGITKQFSWEIQSNGLYQGDTSFQIKVSGEHLDSNVVTRKIRIIGPPQLKATVNLPTLQVVNNQWQPNPLAIEVKIKNNGESKAYNLKAQWLSGSSLKLADGESTEKYLLDLGSKEETAVTWQVQPNGDTDKGQFNMIVTGDNFKQLPISGELTVPSLSSTMNFEASDRFVAGKIVNVDLTAFNLRDATKFVMNVKYNPKQLRLVYISRGTFLIEGDNYAQWERGIINYQNGTVTNIIGIRSQPFHGQLATLFTLNFVVIGNGEGQIELNGAKLYDSQVTEIGSGISPLQYKIEEAED